MQPKKFLEVGSPLISTIDMLRENKNIRITNPDSLLSNKIAKGASARIHSVRGSTYIVWVCDPETYNTIIVEVPQGLMGSFFQQHAHNLFGHFA